MLMTFDVINGDGITNEAIKNAAVMYSDESIIDRICGVVIDIDEHKLVADILDRFKDKLDAEKFVCSKRYIHGGLYHKDINQWGNAWTLVLLERREMVEDARKESKETRE